MSTASGVYRHRRSVLLSLSVAVVIGVSCSFAWAVTPFQDVTSSVGLSGFGGDSVAWGDYDNDGYADLFGSAPYHNNGGTSFTRISSASHPPAATVGDYNNDGYLDVAGYANESSSSPVLQSYNGSTWVNESYKFTGDPTYRSFSNVWGDFNGDGYLDFYATGMTSNSGWWDPVAPIESSDFIWFSNQTNSFSQTWTSPATGYTRGVTTCDFDEDGDLDVYTSNYWITANNLWQNDGAGNFVDVGGTHGVRTSNAHYSYGHGIGSAWGDFDNDGHFDIYASNLAHQDSRINPLSRFFRNQGPGGDYHFQDMGQAGIAWQETYASAATADFDNDGYLDIFVTTIATAGYGDPSEHCVLYRNNGDWTFTDVTSDYGLAEARSTFQAAWGDYNNDGYLDVFTAGKLFRNPGGSNHWLKVKLVGGNGEFARVNHAAIGAQVRIKVDGLGTISRQITASTGQGNQDDLTLHFGLGEHDGPVDLEILWPDGTSQIISGVTVDRAVTVYIPEPTTLSLLALGVLMSLRRRINNI